MVTFDISSSDVVFYSSWYQEPMRIMAKYDKSFKYVIQQLEATSAVMKHTYACIIFDWDGTFHGFCR